MSVYLPRLDIRQMYNRFDAPLVADDCGKLCAPHNPSGKPFCCDICQAVPAAYQQEWEYAQGHTGLWHAWRGDECEQGEMNADQLRSSTVQHMLLLACHGPERCQRRFRLVSCRQFPFFPYVSSDYRFLGLAYDWEFEEQCWVISHLDQVRRNFREEFVRTYDRIFADWQEDFDGYAQLSQEMREHYASMRRRFPLLHRNGGNYLVSPGNERMRRFDPSSSYRRFGFYR